MRFKAEKLGGCAFAKILALGAATIVSMVSSPALAGSTESSGDAIRYEQDGSLARELNMALYEWDLPSVSPRGVVLAVHGLAMHGKSFNHLGRTLAQQGFIVYACDLRGYGRTIDSHNICSDKDCHHQISYDKSAADLVRLATSIRQRHPALPIFGIGESLGAAMVIRLAASNPDLVDGMVLSAPAVKRHALIDPYIIVNAGLLMTNPRAQLDLMPFVRKYSSDDQRVVAEKENDPLLRRHLSAFELLKSTRAIRRTISYVPKIATDTPVLVIQGGKDKVLRADAVITLLSKLRSQDQTVKWFSQRGHILLETEYVLPDTMDAVVSWLNQHVDNPVVQSKCNRRVQHVTAWTPTLKSVAGSMAEPMAEQPAESDR